MGKYTRTKTEVSRGLNDGRLELMNVLIVSQNHVSAYTGGNEVYTHTLATELVRRGHKVTYLTAKGKEKGDYGYRLVVSPGIKLGKYVVPNFSWFRVVDEIKPDVIHATGSGLGITAMGGWARLKRIKNVLTFQAPQTGSLWGRIDEAVQIRLFDRIIVTSPKNREYLRKHTEAKVSLVMLCLKNYFKNILKIDKQNARKRLRLKQKHHYVLMVAKLDHHHYYKGVEVALRAIKLLGEDFKLVIIGDGELLSYYQQYCLTLGVSGKTIFAGKVADKEQYLWYRAADVLIMPSVNESEGFGLVLLEAMASRLPVVTTSCVGIAPLLAKRRLAKVISPNNFVELAKAIRHPLMWKDQIDAAEAFAWSRTAEAMAVETEKIYEK